jgi:hypothetical protein
MTALSCGGDEAAERVCVPGRTMACACAGSASQGVQICLPDGSAYEPCGGCEGSDVGLFTDATTAAGLDYRQSAPFDPPTNCAVPEACQLNIITGGAAVGDYDADGWPDLYVTTLMAWPILFRNQGDGTFADVTEAVGLRRYGNTNGAAWLDVDNDADLDLYVMTIGFDRYYLYLNDGTGHFDEQAEKRGAAMDDGELKAATSVAVGDYDRDGYLDLHLTEWGPKGSGAFGFLDPSKPGHTRLLRNLGKKSPGHFEDVTSASGAQLDVPKFDGTYSSVFSFSNAFVDFDGDDWPELAITGDFVTSAFLWNDGGVFTNGTKHAGLGKDKFGMGSAIGDLDGDGLLDWFVTSIAGGPDCILGLCLGGETGNHFYRYLGARKFDDSSTEALGINLGHWGWGAEMFDYDNDGDLDLVQTNGVDYPFVPAGHFFTHDPMRFWRNEGGKMVEMAKTIGFDERRMGRGLVTFDYDQDGDLDVFIAHNGNKGALYRNDTNRGDWLRVRVLTADGRDALGAKLTLTVAEGGKSQVTQVGLGSHFLSQSEAIVHFGLPGSGAPVHELRVHYGDTGQDEVLMGLERNTLVVVKP